MRLRGFKLLVGIIICPTLVKASQQETSSQHKHIKGKGQIPWRRISCIIQHHAMKTYWGSGGLAPNINLDTGWRWVVSFTPRPLYPRGKSLRYPLGRRLDRPDSRSGRGAKEKKSNDCPCWELNPDRPAQLYTGWSTPAAAIYLTTVKFHCYKHWRDSRSVQLVSNVSLTVCNNGCFIKIWLCWTSSTAGGKSNEHISGAGPHEDSIFNSQTSVYIKHIFNSKECPTKLPCNLQIPNESKQGISNLSSNILYT
jgi:hypothetical protein